jgi:phospholipid/cholesterol/gamma-HCH transport system substrate-binding protein
VKKAIRTYSTDVVAMVVLAVIAIFVGGYILSNQRFYLPGWVPFVGTDFFTLKAEMQTAQAITPGQGQTVAMSGVPVGEISGVELKNGRAVVTMSIRAKYADDIHRNATILSRPKTGLNDMLLQLDPGTRNAGKAPDGYTLPVSQTLPNVNPDEVLASLDTGTRDYLKLLIGGAGEGLDGNAENLSNTFRRFEPTSRDIDKITKQLSYRQRYIARNITNLKKISQALAGNDQQLSAWVESANAVFSDFASQDRSLRAAIAELPTALQATNSAVQSADTLGRTLGPTLDELQPFARGLYPTSIASQDFFNETTDVLKNQLRPFATKVQPAVAELRPTAARLAKANPQVSGSLDELNYIFDTLAYEPAGKPNSYLFFLGWLNHISALTFTNQDAIGPVRRGVFITNCNNATVLHQIKKDNTPLGTLTNLVNAPSVWVACKDDPTVITTLLASGETPPPGFVIPVGTILPPNYVLPPGVTLAPGFKTRTATAGAAPATTTATAPTATTPAATTPATTTPAATTTTEVQATAVPTTPSTPELSDEPTAEGTR